MSAPLSKLVLCVGLVLALMGSAEASAAKPRHARASARPQVSGVVNLNQASVAELDLLPGVGAKAAQAIVTYRGEHRFARAEEIVKVKGFGKRRFEKLKAFLSVQGPTTLRKVAILAVPKAVAHTS